jgi:VNT family MFS transporter (synaptic vesicle glycoprotein 2)
MTTIDAGDGGSIAGSFAASPSQRSSGAQGQSVVSASAASQSGSASVWGASGSSQALPLPSAYAAAQNRPVRSVNDTPRTIDDFLQQAYDETSTATYKPWRTHYWLSFWALGIANSGDATEVGCLNYILSYPAFQYEILQLDLAHRGALLTSSVYAGMLLGGLFTGAVWGDQGRYGRKPTCLCGLSLNALSGLLSAFAPNVLVMSACRFVGGLGIGAVLSSLIAFATEISPPKQRGLFVTFVASFWTLGSITVASLAYVLLGHREASWRLFMASCAFPALFGVIAVYNFVPESPRFLALHGHSYQAVYNANQFADSMGFRGAPLTLEEVQHHYGDNGNHHRAAEANKILAEEPVDEHGAGAGAAVVSATAIAPVWEEAPQQVQAITTPSSQSRCGHQTHVLKVAGHNIKTLYATREIRRFHTVPLQIIWFCMSFGSGLCTWLNTLFTEIGIADVYGSALLFALANIPGNLASAYLLDRVGRKPMLLWSMVMSAVCLWIFAFGAHGAMLIQNNENALQVVGMGTTSDGGAGAPPPYDSQFSLNFYTGLVVASACVFHAFMVCSWCCISCMTGETFPTSIRSTGMGVCAGTGRIAAMMVQYVNGSLIGTPSFLLIVSSMMILVGASCPWFLKMPDFSHQPLQDNISRGSSGASAGTDDASSKCSTGSADGNGSQHVEQSTPGATIIPIKSSSTLTKRTPPVMIAGEAV